MLTTTVRATMCLLALAVCAGPCAAQDNARLDTQLKDLDSAVDSIAEQMNFVTVQLARASESYGPDHPKVQALRKEIVFLKQRLQDRLDTERQVQEVHVEQVARQLQERIAELDARRSQLDAVSRGIRDTEDAIVMSPEALKLMAEKIGEAQIENRLRELESKALIEALTGIMKTARPVEELEEIKTQEMLVQAQRLAMDRVAELAKKGYVSQAELQAKEIELKKAEDSLRFLQKVSPRQTQLDARIAEAATQRAVSIAMQKLLIAEAQRINELLKKSAASQEVQSEAALVRNRIHDLKQQLMDVEIQSTLQSKELTRLNMLLQQADREAAPKKKQDSVKKQ